MRERCEDLVKITSQRSGRPRKSVAWPGVFRRAESPVPGREAAHMQLRDPAPGGIGLDHLL